MVAIVYGFLVVVTDVLCTNDRSSIGNVLPIEEVVDYDHQGDGEYDVSLCDFR